MLENALSKISRTNIRIYAAGRTDSGVHAQKMVAHFELEELPENFIFKLNNYLPKSISITKIEPVTEKAHARFDALERTYQYFVITEKNPFKELFAYYYFSNLDLEKMNEAAQKLLLYKDFSSFEKMHSDNKTSICDVKFAEWKKENNQYIFTIKADRFLRNMVRAIVGTLLEVGKGKISVSEFEEIITRKERTFAATSAPAKGLFLTEITYPQALFL